MFDERENADMICSLYKRANAKKACECNCSNADVDELMKFTTPMFSWTGIKQTLDVEQDKMENVKFYKEIIAFGKYIAQVILEHVPVGTLSNTENIAKFKEALCSAIKTPNKGSIMAILFIWCCTRAKQLAIAKERKQAQASVEEIDDFLNCVIDAMGKTLYAGMVNITKNCNRPFYKLLSTQKDIVKTMIAEPLKTLYITYDNAETDLIAMFYQKHILSDMDNFRHWMSIMVTIKDKPALEYIYQVNAYIMKKLYKQKLHQQKHDRKDVLLNQLNQLGGFKSFADINEEEDIEATLKGMACKGATALDELLGNNKCKYDSVSGLLNSVSKRTPKNFL